MIKVKDGYAKLIGTTYSGSADRVLLSNGEDKAVSDFAAASGVVTALGTNGDYVTWTKNGTANNLTVPYASYSDRLGKTWKEDINYAYGSGSSVKIICTSGNSAGNFASAYQSGLSVMSDYVGWQLTSYGGGEQNPYFRSLQDNGVWKPWKKLAFTSDIPTSLPANGGDADTLDGYHYNGLPYLPLGGGTMTGSITMNANHYIYGVYETSGAMVYFDGTRTILGSVGSASTSNTHIRTKDAKLTIGTGTTASYTVLHTGNYYSTLDNRYYTETEVNNLLSNYLPTNGIAAAASKLTSTKVFAFGASAATYCKVASINITGRYGGGSGLLKFYTNRTTSPETYFADSFEVFVHAYQQNPIGEKPVLQFKSTNTGDAYDIIGILNYSSSGSTFDIYAYGKGRSYHGLYVTLVHGDITIAPGSYVSSLPSGTQVTPLPMGNAKLLNGFADSAFWKKTELTKLSQLTDDIVTGNYLPLAGGNMKNTAVITFTANGTLRQTTATTSNATSIVEWYKGTTKDPNYTHPAQIGWHNTGNTDGAIYLVPHPTDTDPWASSVGLYIGKTSLKWNNQGIIHSGNIGSQSVNYANTAGSAPANGGNSDTVDGYHAGQSNKPWGTIPIITSSGYMDVGKHLEFHFDNTTGSDYSTALMCTGNYNNIVNLPSASGTLVLTSQIPTSLPANGGNSDTVDNLHAGDFTRFYLSPMTSSAPADSAKSWFINTMPSASGAIVYNVPGSEKTIIAGKSSGTYGHMLQLNYDDNYLRILRYYNGTWKTADWEKIAAGYADSAEAIKDSNNGTRITACYSTGGFSSNPSWLAAWNGYHLTYVSPGVLSVNYATSAGSAGDANTLDGYDSSAFAKIGTYNNLTHAGNEFTFASSAFSGDMWINYRTASGSLDGAITGYYFGDGKGGNLAKITSGNFSGNSNSASKLILTSCYGTTTNGNLWSTIKTGTASYLGTATVYEVYNNGGPDTYGEVLDIVSVHNSHWQPQLWFGSGKEGRLRYRNKDYNNNSWGDWRTVAFISDLPSVGNGTVTITQAGTTIGSFTMNQSGNTTINLTDNNTNYYPIRSYTSGLQISSYSGSANCALYVPNATASQSGVVSTAAQTFAGAKTFSGVMTVNNAVYATGGFYESSDERLKNILKPVKVNLDDLSKLRKVYYLWRDRSEDGIQLGMIAQDVQRLYPELVSVDKETGYLSLAYDKLSVLALEAIDALYNDYKKLKERVDKLERFLINKGIS